MEPRTALATLAFLVAASLPTSAQTQRAWQAVGPAGFSDWATICTRIASDASGIVYVAYQDLMPGLSARVTVKKLVGDTWQNVGPSGSGSVGSGYYCNLAFDAQNRLYVATRDYALAGKAGVRRWDAGAGTWTSIGTSAGPDEAHYVDIAMAPDGLPCVAYSNTSLGDRATAVRFDGTSWNAIGGQVHSPAGATYARIVVAPNGTIYTAYADGAVLDTSNVGKGTVQRWDSQGGTWAYVGPQGFTANGATNLTLALDRTGVPWVAYHRYNQAIVVLRFDGTSWVPAGGSPTGGDQPTVESESWRQWLSLQFDSQNRPYIAYQLFQNGRRAAVRRLEGNDWVLVGQNGFTPGGADYLSMVVDAQDTPWVAYRDVANGQRISVMRYTTVAQNYCASMPNSLGCSATISSSGAPSLTGVTPFTIRAGNVLNNTTGMLVWGQQAASLPFGGGTLCVGSLRRTSALSTGGAAGGPSCTGILQRDFGADLAGGLPGVWLGSTLYAQFWYRDVGAPAGFALSDGLRFTVGY